MRAGVNLCDGIVSVNAQSVESLARAAAWFPSVALALSLTTPQASLIPLQDLFGRRRVVVGARRNGRRR